MYQIKLPIDMLNTVVYTCTSTVFFACCCFLSKIRVASGSLKPQDGNLNWSDIYLSIPDIEWSSQTMFNIRKISASAASLGASLLLSAITVTATAQQTTPVLEVTGSYGEGQFGQNVSAGWSFTTNQRITVDALDAFDPSITGDVRLYDASGLIASATLTTSDIQVGSPVPFYSQSITPVYLQNHHTYYIVQDMSALTNTLIFASGLVTHPYITYNGSIVEPLLGLDPTIDASSGDYLPAFFGPNFNIHLPEPGLTGLLISSGITGLLCIRRRRRV